MGEQKKQKKQTMRGDVRTKVESKRKREKRSKTNHQKNKKRRRRRTNKIIPGTATPTDSAMGVESISFFGA